MLNIATCEEIHKAKNDKNHPCYKIVHYQESLPSFQIPEPWNGNIETAKILFISSNPSIDISGKEYYPTMDWDKDKENYHLSAGWTEKKVEDYFVNRLKSDDYKKRKNSEKRTDGGVQYWYRSRMIASELLNIKFDDNKLEDSYCYTEIVHCKSKSEVGVSEACKICFFKRTMEIIKLAKKVKYIVVVGGKAQSKFNSLRKKYNELNKIIEEKKIKVIYSYAPSRWGMAKPKPIGIDTITRGNYIKYFIHPYK